MNFDFTSDAGLVKRDPHAPATVLHRRLVSTMTYAKRCRKHGCDHAAIPAAPLLYACPACHPEAFQKETAR